MAPDRAVETINVAADGLLGILTCFKHGAPDEFRPQRLEERLDHGVVVAIPFARHRNQDAVLSELRSVASGAILAATLRMMDQPRRRAAHGEDLPPRRPVLIDTIISKH